MLYVVVLFHIYVIPLLHIYVVGLYFLILLCDLLFFFFLIQIIFNTYLHIFQMGPVSMSNMPKT